MKRFPRCLSARLLAVAALGLASAPPLMAEDAPRRAHKRFEALFRILDKDGDGKLTRQEMGAPKTFERLDTDGDGILTLEEAKKAFAGKASQEDQETDPEEMTVLEDLRYRHIDGVDPDRLSLDLYAPEGAKDLPVVVYVHGGGWARGDKSRVHLKPAFFTGDKRLFVSLNYRLVPEGFHPNNVQDVAHALAWIHENIAEHGGDPDKIFLLGHSAGAHLVALVATDGRRLQAAGKDLSILKGVIPLDTSCYDVNSFLSQTASGVHRKAFGDDPAIWKDASPAAHVAKGKSIPPFLIFVANNPRKGKRTEAFARTLREAGVRAEVVYAPEHDHGSLNHTLGEPGEKTTKAIRRFLATQDVGAGRDPAAEAERLFERFDRNGDGKLDPSELKSKRLFQNLDADGDGVVTLEESKQYAGAWSRLNDPRRYDPSKPLAVSRSDAFTDLAFARDYAPGEQDPEGRWRGGTETLRLVTHKGMLFASLGYWTDKPYGLDKGDEPWTGAQILRKDRHDGPWVVDANFGKTFIRVEGMISAVFTADASGTPLDPPANLLVAGPSSRRLTVWTRDDASGAWTEIQIRTRVRRNGVRSFCTHIDAVTGVHHLFAGGKGILLRGAYDADAPGRLVWDEEPELAGTGRVMCMAEANGVLYAAAGIHDEDPAMGGLYRRIDGKAPRWERVWQWPIFRREDANEGEIMRGLTAVPAPEGGSHEVLVGTCNFPGVVYRIDPEKGHEVATELDIRAYFARSWEVPSLQGACLSAYNRLVPAIDPDTGETVHLIGVWVNHPAGRQTDLGLSAWYLVRHADGTYAHGRVFAPGAPLNHAERGLEATRTLEVSPFPEDEGRVLYAGGFDCAKKDSHNTAWIYRGVLRAKGGERGKGE